MAFTKLATAAYYGRLEEIATLTAASKDDLDTPAGKGSFTPVYLAAQNGHDKVR